MSMRTITFDNIKEPHTYSKDRDTYDSDIIAVDTDILGFNESGCSVTIGNKVYFCKPNSNKMHFDGNSNKLAVMYNILPDKEKLDETYTIIVRMWKETNEMKVTYLKSNNSLEDIEKITCNIDVK